MTTWTRNSTTDWYTHVDYPGVIIRLTSGWSKWEVAKVARRLVGTHRFNVMNRSHLLEDAKKTVEQEYSRWMNAKDLT